MSLLAPNRALDDALASQNTRVQGAAEKWLGAVTALYGLFSLTGIATAKDALAGIGTGAKVLIAIVLLAGLGAAGTALLLGYRVRLAGGHRRHRKHRPASLVREAPRPRDDRRRPAPRRGVRGGRLAGGGHRGDAAGVVPAPGGLTPAPSPAVGGILARPTAGRRRAR
ncbi:MAG: hypothetical protein ACRDT6_16065 [Micromonosporaceae bacterium]